MRLRKPIITAIVALLSFSVLADSNPSETPELDRLKAKHDIENPERNFRELEGLDFSQSEDNDQRTEELLDEMFARGLQDGGQVDLSRYNQEINREQLQSNAASWALRSSSNVGMPSMNDDGNIKLEYSQEGTLKHVRNENGEYGFAASDGGARRTAGLAQEDLYTQEVNNEDHARFDGVRDAYGDEETLFREGSANIGQLRNQQNLTSDAVAYRTILNSQERALDTELNESFLDGTVEFLDGVQNDPSDFFSECRTIQTTTKVGAEGELNRDYSCTDVDRNNYDFCEIRRDYRMPLFLEGESVGICGPDCFFVEIGDPDVGLKSATHCDLFEESRTVTLNLDSGISIRAVSVEGGVDDHARILINDRAVFSLVWQQASVDTPLPPTGPGAPKCETSTWNTFNQNVTGHALSAINSVSPDQDGRITLNIAMNSAIRHEGGYHARIKFYFDDDLGLGFGEKITSYPEGCYERTNKKSGGRGDQTCKLEYVCPAERSWNLPLSDQICTGQLIWEDPDSAAVDRACLYNSTSCNANFQSDRQTTQTCSTPPGGDSMPEGEAVCSFHGYEIIEEGTRRFPDSILDNLGPLFPGDTGNVTWRANLEGYACEPFDGEEICVTPYNSDGEVCKSWYGWFGRHDDDLSSFPAEHPALNDACAEYRNNPNCERIESECAEGMMDGEICRIANVQYKCSVGVGGSREIITETNQCDAMIPCAGGECDNTNNEINQDFNKAALQASLLHEMNNDNTCVDNDEGCEIFSGTYSQCAKGTGIVSAVSLAGPDCCDDPTAVGVQEYILAARQVSQFQTVQDTASWAATPFKGGYDKIKSGARSGWNKISSPFTSSSDSFAANSSGAAGAGGDAGNIYDRGMEALREATMEWMANNLPEGITHAIFATTVEGVGEEAVTKLVDPPEFSEGMQAVGNFAQGLMTAYGYYTMAKLVMDIAFACEPEESEAAGSIAQLQCVYLGEGDCKLNLFVGCARREYEYCCFNSLLARIIMEQAVEQLGRPLEQDEGSCRGLTLEELSQIDWDLIDLESEWLPLMYESGLIFDNTSEEMLTGDGRTLNKGAREVVSERTKNRFRDISDDDVREIDNELKTTLDCSKYPRPLVCNYQ